MDLSDQPDNPPRVLQLWPDMAIARRLWRLGSYVMLAMITQFLVNAADNLMVGRLPAEEATASQAALGVGMPLFWAIGGFFSAVSFGTQAMTARRIAEGDASKAGQVLFNSVIVAIFAGILGTLLGYWLTPHAVSFFGAASAEQSRLATAYTQVRCLGILSMVVTFSYKAFFDGIGRTYVHLWAAVVMNFVNIALNYLLIYGSESLSIPTMGLSGAAWASTISTYLGLTIMIAVSLWPGYRNGFSIYRWSHRSLAIAGRIIKLLLPSGSATVILMLGFLLFMKFVGDLDAAEGMNNAYLAATKAVMDTAALCFMPLLAFGTATATAVSQSLGARKTHLAARYGWEAVRVALWAMLPVMVGILIFPESILSFWAPKDPTVVEVGVLPLRLVASSIPLMVVGLILSQALYGAGANTYVMVAEGILHLGVLVPLSWLLGPKLGYGLPGIWTAAVVYVNALGILMAAKFLGRGWRTLRL